MVASDIPFKHSSNNPNSSLRWSFTISLSHDRAPLNVRRPKFIDAKAKRCLRPISGNRAASNPHVEVTESKHHLLVMVWQMQRTPPTNRQPSALLLCSISFGRIEICIAYALHDVNVYIKIYKYMLFIYTYNKGRRHLFAHARHDR